MQLKLASVQAQPRGVAYVDGARTSATGVYLPDAAGCPILVHNMSFPLTLATGTVVAATGVSGTLADGVYGFYFTVTNDYGEGLPSEEISVEVLGGSASGSIAFTWTDPTALDGPQGHPPVHIHIYGRTAGGPGLYMAEVDIGVQTWTDDGSITPSGAIPTTDGTGKSCSIAIATKADEAGRTVDPSSVQPIDVDQGECKQIGPFVAKWYGQGDTGNDIALYLTCDDYTNVWVYIIRP